MLEVTDLDGQQLFIELDRIDIVLALDVGKTAITLKGSSRVIYIREEAEDVRRRLRAVQRLHDRSRTE